MNPGLETVRVDCPYCGESIETLLDTPEAGRRYVEDCPVCCRPIEFRIISAGEQYTVTAAREDD